MRIPYFSAAKERFVKGWRSVLTDPEPSRYNSYRAGRFVGEIVGDFLYFVTPKPLKPMLERGSENLARKLGISNYNSL